MKPVICRGLTGDYAITNERLQSAVSSYTQY